MQSISKEAVREMLAFVVMRTELAMNRTISIEQYQDFILTPGGVDIFDATCMRLQTIDETDKCRTQRAITETIY